MSKPFSMELCKQRAAGCALGGMLICLVSLFFARADVWRSYWLAWLFFAGLGFGSLAMILLQYLTGGAWSQALQRPAEAAVRTLPLMAILVIPALLGLGDIFPWLHPGDPAGHDWPNKSRYLTGLWFTVRTLLYFAVLLGVLLLLLRRSKSLSARLPALPTLSGPGLAAYVLCMNFAATDWVMSIEPQWYSTMFAVIFMVSQFLSALALAVFTALIAGRDPAFGPPLSDKQFLDLGNLLLAFVTFWAYVSFAQFLIIWSGNLPHEISWYLHRREGGWPWVAGFLALFQFAIPFALLLSRATKRHARRLAPIAALVLGATAVHLFWLVMPSYRHAHFSIQWLDLAAWAGIGGLWLLTYLHFLGRAPGLLPAEGRSHV